MYTPCKVKDMYTRCKVNVVRHIPPVFNNYISEILLSHTCVNEIVCIIKLCLELLKFPIMEELIEANDKKKLLNFNVCEIKSLPNSMSTE